MNRAAVVCLASLLFSGPIHAQAGNPLTTREPAASNWIFSETTSPLDYAPVIIASAWASDSSAGPEMQLSIQCRRGRTDLVIASPALTGRAEDQRVFYRVDDGQLVKLLSGIAAGGAGIAIRNDVVPLLASLPGQGEIAFQVTGPQAAPLQGRYALGSLKAVLDRMAAPCKWPFNAANPPKAQSQQ